MTIAASMTVLPSGSQHRNSGMSTHTVYDADEVDGVPGISSGAGDDGGVGDGSGSQHRNRSTRTGAQHPVMGDTASVDSVWTSMVQRSSHNRRQILKRMRAHMENQSPEPPPG